MFDVHMENLVEPDVTRVTRHIDQSQRAPQLGHFRRPTMGQLGLLKGTPTLMNSTDRDLELSRVSWWKLHHKGSPGVKAFFTKLMTNKIISFSVFNKKQYQAASPASPASPNNIYDVSIHHSFGQN